ncbi:PLASMODESMATA CALLOSE-BINDING PROTEIN 5-like [Vicia villosa]|uniref:PLASMODESMATA CALLOSE-BINDING PROTEIN 5-like n=1 Tax=Vicia villosa TaxID=3911 RepID=UPI00273BE373|nr:PLASMODESMATA CALLOSE-BINDING PROTEIN 5-like [Vicia villosa]
MPTTQTFVFPLLFLFLILSPFCCGGDATKQELWCVAKNNAEDAALQSALDWACGAGGADCRPIQNGGPCYDVNSVQNTASFAFNDYFLKNGLTDDSCNFSNNAAVTSIDPSHDKCKFPSGLAAINGSSSGSKSSPSAGLGPSGNVSGCSKASWRWWFWLSAITNLLLMVSLYA